MPPNQNRFADLHKVPPPIFCTSRFQRWTPVSGAEHRACISPVPAKEAAAPAEPPPHTVVVHASFSCSSAFSYFPPFKRLGILQS